MWFLQSLQGQVSGFQNLIKLLNWFGELDFIFLVLNVTQIEYHNELT